MRMEKSSGLQNFSEKSNGFADQWSQAVQTLWFSGCKRYAFRVNSSGSISKNHLR